MSSSYLTTSVNLWYPAAVFVSRNKEIYIADTGNHRIRKILRNGKIITIAGTGKMEFNIEEGPATSVNIDPVSLFVTSTNEVYFADQQNNRIRKISPSGIVKTIAGNGQKGFSGDDGPAVNAMTSYPKNVFVHDHEVYFADHSNHRIRKILRNGNIVTIAGTGKVGFSGDGGLATKAQLNYPSCVIVYNKEVYIVDNSNHRIRKILQNGKIITIAGTGNRGGMGDGGPAINARLNFPDHIFISNNEVYIAEASGRKIRKLLENGNIITIAGTGREADGGDGDLATKAHFRQPTCVFVSNNEIYIADHWGDKIRKILSNGIIITLVGYMTGYAGDSILEEDDKIYVPTIKLQKYERDLLFDSSVYAFMPLIEIVSPQFYQHILMNETLFKLFNSTQLEIIQKLVDSLIYDQTEFIVDAYSNDDSFKMDEILNWLLILGLFKNNEFIELKKKLTSKYINSIDVKNLSSKWEQTEVQYHYCKNTLQKDNEILANLNNYCLEYAATSMKTSEGSAILSNLDITMRNSTKIFSKLMLYNPTPITINENIEMKPLKVEKLYNDKKTSDLKIQIGQDSFIYCHKTIVSSSSIFFNAILNSGSTFKDLDHDVFIPDSSDDLEILEIIIKACYGIPVIDIKPEMIGLLVDMATKHEIEYLIEYCYCTISLDNYFDIILGCEKIDLECYEDFFNELLKFGIENRYELLSDKRFEQLPQKLLREIKK